MMRRAVPLLVRSMRHGSHNNHFTTPMRTTSLLSTVGAQKNSFHSHVPIPQQQQENSDIADFFTTLEHMMKNKNYKMAVTLLEPMLQLLSSARPTGSYDIYASELSKAKLTHQLCYSYLKSNQIDQCIRCCDEFLLQEPYFQKLNILDHSFNQILDFVLVIKAKALFEKGEYEIAGNYFDFIIKQRITPRLRNNKEDDKDNNRLSRKDLILGIDIQAEQGRLCMVYEQYETALVLFDGVLESVHNDARTYVLRGAAKLWLNRESEGYEDIERGLSLCEGDPDIQCDALIQDAKYHIRVKQNPDLGLQLLNRALALLPERVDALAGRVTLYWIQKDYERVVEDCTTILNLHPGSVFALGMFSLHSYALIKLKRYQDAIQLEVGAREKEFVRATMDCLRENYESVIEYSSDESVLLRETQVMRLECYLRLGLFDRAKSFVKNRMRQPERTDHFEAVLDLLFDWVIDVRSTRSNKGILDEPLAVPDAIADLLQNQMQVVNSSDMFVLLVAQGTYYAGYYSITIDCATCLLSRTYNTISELWAHELAAMAYRASGDMEKAQKHLQDAKAMMLQ